MKVAKLCTECGSDEMLLDAYASWDIEAQEWVLHSTYDEFCCNSCGERSFMVNEKELDEKT